MRLVRKINQHRRDFTGLFECEHCGHEETVRGCYDDTYYHENVIPKMGCRDCGEVAPAWAPRTVPDVPPNVVI